MPIPTAAIGDEFYDAAGLRQIDEARSKAEPAPATIALPADAVPAEVPEAVAAVPVLVPATARDNTVGVPEAD